MITTKSLNRDFNNLKKIALNHYKNGNFTSSLNKIKSAATLAYNFNFVESLGDKELESLLQNISEQLFHDVSFEGTTNKIVFYDTWLWDNRGLSQQYLTALTELGYEILIITPYKLNEKLSKDTIAYVKQNKNTKLISLEEFYTDREKIIELNNIIKEFKPSKAFIHISPWEVVGIAVFCRHKHIKRYFINLTDHAFWLGKNCIDVNLEFRSFGYQLSKLSRGINEDKLYWLPYYPILQKDTEFTGMPSIPPNAVIGITGGSGYKYLGSNNDDFYNLVKPVLIRNKNFILIIAGAKVAQEHISKQATIDQINNQIIFLNDRYDIFPLIKNCDIYLNSYPFLGGLMVQLAAIAKLPILTYTKENMPFNLVEDLLPFRKQTYQTITEKEDFLSTANLLINDLKYRNDYAQLTNDSIITINKFKEALKQIIEDSKSPYIAKSEQLSGISETVHNTSKLFIHQANHLKNNYYNSSNLFTPSEIFKLRNIDSIFYLFQKLANKALQKLIL